MASNYNGTLIRFGDNLQFEIPTILTLYDTYDPASEQLDVDPKRSADEGTLVRNVVASKAHCKVTIRSLPEPIVSEMMQKLHSAISTSNDRDAKEECIYVSFWVPKLGTYHSCYCYMPTLNIKIKRIEEVRKPKAPVPPAGPQESIFDFRPDLYEIKSSKIIYDEFDLEFVEY